MKLTYKTEMVLLYRRVKRRKLIKRFKSWLNAAKWCDKYLSRLSDDKKKQYYFISLPRHMPRV